MVFLLKILLSLVCPNVGRALSVKTGSPQVVGLERINAQNRVVVVQYQSDIDKLDYPHMSLLIFGHVAELADHAYVLYTGGGLLMGSSNEQRFAANDLLLPEGCDGGELTYAVKGFHGCNLHPGWGKLMAMQTAITEFPDAEYFLYLDTDIIPNPAFVYSPVSIIDWYRQLGEACGEDLLSSPKFIVQTDTGFFKTLVNGVAVNDGSFLFQNGPKTRAILSVWLNTSRDSYERATPIDAVGHRDDPVMFRDTWPHAAYTLTRLINDPSYHYGVGGDAIVIPQERNQFLVSDFVNNQKLPERAEFESGKNITLPLAIARSPADGIGASCRSALGSLLWPSADQLASFIQSIGLNSARDLSVFQSRHASEARFVTASCDKSVHFTEMDEYPFEDFCRALDGETAPDMYGISCDVSNQPILGIRVMALAIQEVPPSCRMVCMENSEQQAVGDDSSCHYYHYSRDTDKSAGNELAKAILEKSVGRTLPKTEAQDELRKRSRPLLDHEQLYLSDLYASPNDDGEGPAMAPYAGW